MMNSLSSTALENRLQQYIQYSELKQMAYALADLQQEKRFHSLTVLSFFPGEGKTLFCAAMAMAYGETCRARVLVIDTTTRANKGSLVLRDCFNGSAPHVEVRTLDELRDASSLSWPPAENEFQANHAGPTLEPELFQERRLAAVAPKNNDLSLMQNVIQDRSQKYGLILLDTPPLNARNRDNIEVTRVARLSDASVLVTSRKFLNDPNLAASMKIVEHPSMHLIGMVSNEGAAA